MTTTSRTHLAEPNGRFTLCGWEIVPKRRNAITGMPWNTKEIVPCSPSCGTCQKILQRQLNAEPVRNKHQRA